MTKQYEQKLMAEWEEVYRQGLLTFWVFVALSQKELSVSHIRKEVERLTLGTYSAAEQTLYRLLRKQYELEMVDYREVPGNAGPAKKLYSLSPLGDKLLRRFSRRNIALFHQETIINLINKDLKDDNK